MPDKRLNVCKAAIMGFMVVLAGGLSAACSTTEATDQNIDIVEKVLELQFNGPDERLMELLQNPEYTTIVEDQQVNEELDAYINDVYGEYFTEDYLVPFFQTAGLMYPTAADFSGYELQMKDVVVKQAEKVSNRYTFTATVGYVKPGEQEKVADVSGVVLFSTSEKGKIGKLDYGEDDGLYKELSSVLSDGTD